MAKYDSIIQYTTIALIITLGVLLLFVIAMINAFRTGEEFRHVKVVALLLIIVAVLGFRMKMVLEDSPYARNQEAWPSFIGRVEQIKGDRVTFVDIETGQKISLEISPQEIGEIYEVRYLPYTQIGEYVRKIEE
jgi:hypothetical protein